MERMCGGSDGVWHVTAPLRMCMIELFFLVCINIFLR
jgi:hypothetical protein